MIFIAAAVIGGAIGYFAAANSPSVSPLLGAVVGLVIGAFVGLWIDNNTGTRGMRGGGGDPNDGRGQR